MPSKFAWNNFNPPHRQSVYERASERLGVDLREEEDTVETAESEGAACADHDYATPPTPGSDNSDAIRITSSIVIFGKFRKDLEKLVALAESILVVLYRNSAPEVVIPDI
uniref:Uncharacterized protein n=1 Tax=Knipowitschia caucasica TaxID=637954 RepID=A0AAV2LCA7_KNICA